MCKPDDPSKHSEPDDSESVESYSIEEKSNDVSSQASGNTGTESEHSTKEQELAKKESAAILRLRVAVILVLLAAAVAVSLVVYFVTTGAEKEEYTAQFDGAASKILSSFEEIVGQKLGAIASLGVSFTSYARSQNDTWPFVTMNDFQERAASARSLSDAYFLELLPLVTDDTRLKWEEYALENKGWLDEGRAYQDELGIGLGRRLQKSLTGDNVLEFVNGANNGSSVISDQIFVFDENFVPVPNPPNDGVYFPIWESSPILTAPRDLVNFNLLYYPDYAPYIRLCAETSEVAIGGIDTAPPGGITHPELATSFFAFIMSFAEGKSIDYKGDPMSSVYVPVFDKYDSDRKLVAVLVAVINWATYFEDILPPNSEPVYVILENSCQGPFTFLVSGDSVEFVGQGDLSDRGLNFDFDYATSFTNVTISGNGGYNLNQDKCTYNIQVNPTPQFYGAYHTSMPAYITFAVAMVFAFTAGMFFLYDWLVERRQRLVLNTAMRTNAIVSSLFPQQVRDRLFAAEKDGPVHGTKTRLKSYLTGDLDTTVDQDGIYETKPIADLFPETTVLFADIAGFTAWSSVREPSQVFILLETLYKAFDDIATRRRVFKVETVGDCYVAVTGLPDPLKDHAVAMARFARDCIQKMAELTSKLETTLGPDTGDLRLRVGMHSGPVTAGVLRGERSRFQLFGDTMNTAARMESTGLPNKIHLSQETADQLIASGKSNWLELREDRVFAKGKGELQTYFLNIGQRGGSAQSTSGHSDGTTDESDETPEQKQATAHIYSLASSKTRRLVEWNAEVLSRLLRQIVARRQARKVSLNGAVADLEHKPKPGENVIDEVCEIVALPDFDKRTAQRQPESDSIVLSDAVTEQLHDFVASIAALYRANPFHNFEHASHVTMSVVKLLSRIVAPSDLDFEDGKAAESSLHDHTYGITSDPLTQFACVFSALIHDVDHLGVPNTQLVAESLPIAAVYKGKSVAEQNSVDLSWSLLMDEKYRDLRATIYNDEVEMTRFRQLVVNSVMATDIMDKDLKVLRNSRWDKAFKEKLDEGTRDATNRKATIVIEHLIQASDVSHTMQHWTVYRKWNARLFEEMYKAYKEGRAEKDPSEFWYKGEIGFFDFYIIPLAKKLKDCGVFGVSSDEYLNYATQNRKEWEAKGQLVVEEMMEKIAPLYEKADVDEFQVQERVDV